MFIATPSYMTITLTDGTVVQMRIDRIETTYGGVDRYPGEIAVTLHGHILPSPNVIRISDQSNFAAHRDNTVRYCPNCLKENPLEQQSCLRCGEGL